ncbi:hypothetical protein [Roseateles chitinivorans]
MSLLTVSVRAKRFSGRNATASVAHAAPADGGGPPPFCRTSTST